MDDNSCSFAGGNPVNVAVKLTREDECFTDLARLQNVMIERRVERMCRQFTEILSKMIVQRKVKI